MTAPAAAEKRTLLYDLHQSLGAKMAPFGGYLMPIQYQGIIAEHTATRTGATLFDTCHMGEFMLEGASAMADINRLVSCEISTLEVSRCRYGLLCAEDGTVIDDLIVFRMGTESWMIVVNAATSDGDFAWFQKHVSPTTRFKNLSGTVAKIDLQGPRSPGILSRVTTGTLWNLRYFELRTFVYLGQDILVSRTGYTGEMGFEIFCAPELAVAFWRSCMGNGAVPAGLGARDTLRLECGLPLYGHELSRDHNAAESTLGRSIAPEKDFIGAAALRDKSRLHHHLVGIEIEGRSAARQGDAVLDATGSECGTVTSGSFAPSLGRAIAMAYIKRDIPAVGAPLSIRTARAPLAGRTVELPFYKQATARTPIKNFLDLPA